MSPFWHRPSHGERIAAVAEANGLEYRAEAPEVLGMVRGDARGHTVREVAHVLRGDWKGRPVVGFEAVVGAEPNRTEWWVVIVPVPREGSALTVTRRDGLVTFIFRDQTLSPFSAPAQASESDDLRRLAQRLDIWPLRLACDDDYAAANWLPIHVGFVKSTDEPWVLQIGGDTAWISIPRPEPEKLPAAFDRAAALVDGLDILRRPYS